MMYESEDEQNRIDLLFEGPTKEKNGLKVTVPVKYYDKRDFVTKIEEQLAYFENVFFKVEGIKNDYTIIRHNLFQWSPLVSTGQMHLCLDDVYYPIDWGKLGIDSINFPVALRFNLTDGIFPLPNRETLKYTEEAKKVIINRIKEVSNYFIQIYNQKITESEDIFGVFEHLSNYSKYIDGYNGDKWDAKVLENTGTIPFSIPTLKGIKKLDLNRLYHMREHLTKNYSIPCTLRNNRFESSDKWNKELTFYGLTNSSKTFYIFSDKLSKVVKDYLREIHYRKEVVFLKRSREYVLKGDKSDYSWTHILNLKTHPKKDWRGLIQEFQNIQKILTKDFIDLDKLVIPTQWTEDRKKKKLQILATKGIVRRKKLTGEVTGKEARQLERYVSGKTCKFEPVVIQMATANREKTLTVYGSKDNEDKYQKYYTVFSPKSVRFLVFSDRELKNLKDIDLHNWIKMEDFEKGEHIIFKRAVTAYLINRLIGRYPAVFSKKDILHPISENLVKKLIDLQTYKSKYFINGNAELYEDMLAIAEEKNLFDPNMYPLYKEINGNLSKLPFLQAILNLGGSALYNYSTIPVEVTDAIRDLFKYYKKRIDWKNYNLPLNEEVLKELTEPELEELQETI